MGPHPEPTPTVSPLAPTVLEIPEYGELRLPKDQLSMAEAAMLDRSHREQVSIEAPSFRNPDQWVLRASGWVGQIPISKSLVLVLKPKVPIRNIFGMYEWAHQLKSLHLLKGMVHSGSLDDLFEQLARVLATGALERSRQGLYRAYVPRSDRLPYLRGRLDLSERLRRPWSGRLGCRYQDFTADILENQLLAWTFHVIARSGLLGERSRPTVRRAYGIFHQAVTPRPLQAHDCGEVKYHRLNADYEPLHALCRFFLAHAGPTHTTGKHGMLPFVVDMSRLFEQFVRGWLERHLPDRYQLVSQERLVIGGEKGVEFLMDIVIREREHHRPVLVIDTKYKGESKPSTDDLHQIIAYAHSLGCPRAALVYPHSRADGFQDLVGTTTQLKTLSFDIGQDLDAAGQTLLEGIVRWVNQDQT